MRDQKVKLKRFVVQLVHLSNYLDLDVLLTRWRFLFLQLDSSPWRCSAKTADSFVGSVFMEASGTLIWFVGAAIVCTNCLIWCQLTPKSMDVFFFCPSRGLIDPKALIDVTNTWRGDGAETKPPFRCPTVPPIPIFRGCILVPYVDFSGFKLIGILYCRKLCVRVTFKSSKTTEVGAPAWLLTTCISSVSRLYFQRWFMMIQFYS